ncbi:MAG: hypothetical protein R3F19_29755 [Verrucomicrobiales bacterium]
MEYPAPPGGLFGQDFDGIADGAQEFDDGSLLESNDGNSRVEGGELILTEDGIGGSQAAYKTPVMGPELARGFTVVFDFALDATGTPADGVSFNYGKITDTGTSSEEGYGSGLTVSFDTYDNGDENGLGTGIGVDIKIDGGLVPDGSIREGLETNDDGFLANSFYVFDGVFRPVVISWTPSADGGSVTVSLGDVILFENLPTPGLSPRQPIDLHGLRAQGGV